MNDELTWEQMREKAAFGFYLYYPHPFILIPVGKYNGVNLPDTIIDENNNVWLSLPNQECDCEVIMD